MVNTNKKPANHKLKGTKLFGNQIKIKVCIGLLNIFYCNTYKMLKKVENSSMISIIHNGFVLLLKMAMNAVSLQVSPFRGNLTFSHISHFLHIIHNKS